MNAEERARKRQNAELLNSPAMRPFMDRLAAELNGAFIISNNQKKEVVLTVKCVIDVKERREYEKEEVVDEWLEPKMEYQIARKITETKFTDKSHFPVDELKIEFSEDGHPVIGDKNEQLRLDI